MKQNEKYIFTCIPQTTSCYCNALLVLYNLTDIKQMHGFMARKADTKVAQDQLVLPLQAGST